ncbi:MAG: YdiU family protein, partial [Proteobacteria bacterium]|nr:YdiU family protein [Pseudomonadota bacterium]
MEDLEKNNPVLTPSVMYASVKPTPVSAPELLCWSDDMARILELPSILELTKFPDQERFLTQVFGGNSILPGMHTLATRYGGHQFGQWAGQLGDGRAICLGELVPSNGNRWEIQLKGAGPTPYSRHADGRAVLRSSLREFLCSEAMYHLRVPTTRALCCVVTGDEVIRDMFYDGNPAAEPGAITTRAAPSFLRFGHFEILASAGEHDLLRELIHYAIQIQPESRSKSLASPPTTAGAQKNMPWDEQSVNSWFSRICHETAWLTCEWLRVGFVHGVMNTDNMSILGLTIDYGPYGWLDNYDPTWTPNTTDFQRRRYRYEQQPGIAHWNLAKLADALSSVLTNREGLDAALAGYIQNFRDFYRKMRLDKLGLSDLGSHDDAE